MPPMVPPQVTKGTTTGNYSPAGVLVRVMTTTVGDGSAFTATMVVSAYAFANRPPGDYTLAYELDAGY